jgi:hypothetical protein
MDLVCIEIGGALYQPDKIISLDNVWIIPATKNTGVVETGQCKLIFASQKDKQQTVNLFIFCYQFLFLRSAIYSYSSLQQSLLSFEESGKDIDEITDKIFKKYETGGVFKLSFDEIDTFHTQLPDKINFTEFHNRFIKKYNEDNNFRNLIDLYLHTVGSKPKYYDNIFQKISQLQTIFEVILGKPEQEVRSCGERHNKEDWKPFLKRKLQEKGIEDEQEVDLIIKIKSILNWSARVKYTHHAKQLNTRQKTLEEIKAGTHMKGKSEYTTNFEDILNNTLKVKDWAGIDWENVCYLYQIIIKQLIYIEHLK